MLPLTIAGGSFVNWHPVDATIEIAFDAVVVEAPHGGCAEQRGHRPRVNLAVVPYRGAERGSNP